MSRSWLLRLADREEWLARRRQSVGGSDIGAIVGVNPWRGPFDVYAEKLGLVVVPETQAMRMGRRLEPVVLTEYGEVTGRAVTPTPLTVVVHPRVTIAAASLDALATCPDGAQLAVEAKTSRSAARWGETVADIPPEYLCQAHWYRRILDDVTGGEIATVDIAALIAGVELRVYTVVADEELEALLLEEAERFWRDHVLAGHPPAMTGSQASAEWLRQRYPAHTAGMRPATDAEEELVAELLRVRVKREEVEAEEEALANQLRAAIGEHDGLITAAGPVTWRKTKDQHQVDWRAVAQALNPPEELVAAHTTIKAGARRLLLPKGRNE